MPAYLWDRLAEKEAVKGVGAGEELILLGDATTTLLSRHMNPVLSAPAATLKKLIADLDDGKFEVRDRAETKLAEYGATAETALRESSKSDLSVQARSSVRSLLSRLGGRSASGEMLRMSRAIYVLETLGTPKARLLLAKLAGGAPEAPLSKEAKAATERLKRRGAK